MAAKQLSRRTLALLLVTIAAGAVLVAIWPAGSADTSGSTGAQVPGAATRLEATVPAPVGLERLSAAPVAPSNRRDLFRIGPAEPEPGEQPEAPPVGSSSGGRRGGRNTAPAPVPEIPAGPVTPPPPPPIPVRYLWYVVGIDGVKFAGLSDGQATHLAREGQVVEGQWRVIRISEDAIVIERLDGSGRQTIRLSGG